MKQQHYSAKNYPLFPTIFLGNPVKNEDFFIFLAKKNGSGHLISTPFGTMPYKYFPAFPGHPVDDPAGHYTSLRPESFQSSLFIRLRQPDLITADEKMPQGENIEVLIQLHVMA